jgi:hypothetical protein
VPEDLAAKVKLSVNIENPSFLTPSQPLALSFLKPPHPPAPSPQGEGERRVIVQIIS